MTRGARQFGLEDVPANIEWLDSVGSTNDYLASKGPKSAPQIALTWDQTAGRGRINRKWHGHRHESLALSIDLGELSSVARHESWRGFIPLFAGATLARTVMTHLTEPARVKWPNDVLIRDKKLAGILCELRDQGQFIVGVGINVWGVPPDLPTDSVACLAEVGLSDEEELETLVGEFCSSIIRRLSEGPRDVEASDWKAVEHQLSTVGQRVVASLPDGAVFTGYATGLDSSGRLRVDTGTEIRTISAGDITHLRVN